MLLKENTIKKNNNDNKKECNLWNTVRDFITFFTKCKTYLFCIIILSLYIIILSCKEIKLSFKEIRLSV